MKTNETLPVNLDKNIVQQNTSLKLHDQDEFTKSLVGGLLVYFCFSHQSDLFGYKTLDPYDFAKKLGVSQQDLFKTHPNPQYILDNYDGDFKAESYLENALYILFSRVLVSEYITKDVTDNKIIKLKNFRILSDIEIHERETKAKGTKKKLYFYSLSPEFEKNITNFFIRTSIETYIRCRRKNIDNFYLFCLNNYNSNKYNGFEKNHIFLSLDFLTNIFEISKELEPRKKKEKINKYISYSKELIKDIPDINFEWVKGENSSYAYTLKLSWSNPSKEALKLETDNILSTTFYNSLKRRFLEEYKKNMTPELSEKLQNIGSFNNEEDILFYRWLCLLNNTAFQRVKEIYIEVYYQIYNRKQEGYFNLPDIFATKFSNKLSKVKNINDFNLVFSSEEFE